MIIRVTLSYGGGLSERALWLLLNSLILEEAAKSLKPGWRRSVLVAWTARCHRDMRCDSNCTPPNQRSVAMWRASLKTRNPEKNESNAAKVTQIQQFPRVTSIGSLPPKNLARTPAEPRRTLGETPQSPLREPRRALWEPRRALWEASFLEKPRGGLCPSDGDPPEL